MRSSRTLALALTATLAIVVLAVVVKATAAPQQTLPIRTIAVEKKTVKQEKQTKQLQALRHLIASQRTLTWQCQESLGTPRTKASAGVWALPASVPYRKWVLAHWKTQKASCQKTLKAHTIPLTNDWVTATALADRVFPGTQRWLLSCSSGEGSHGGFVMNHQGSGAGGWMQFLSSTYYAHNDTAFYVARSMGFLIPEAANSWYHPLGQAITAAYLRTHGGSSNWDPRIDYLCA